MKLRATFFLVAGLALAAIVIGPARAAGECAGLRVCLPVAGPWVVVPPGGAEYELGCPLPGYIVAGTDARAASADVDVSFRAELGSPVGPGVSTRRSILFRAAASSAPGSSFRPFIGCIPTSGGGGRALTGTAARSAVIRPSQPVRSVVVSKRVRGNALTLRVACPSGTRLVGSTSAVAFRRESPPSDALIGAVRVRRVVVDGVVVARATATPTASGARAEVQVRALCARER